MERNTLKGSLLATLVVTMAIFSLCMVSASVTVVSPGASATVSGTAVLNASGTNLMNCTFYAYSASTANSTWTSLGTFTNATADAASINGTFASAGLEDATDYVFNATCRNQTNSLHDGTRTGITVDNTVPTAPSSLSPSSDTSDTDGTVTFSGTVVGRETTACTLYFVGTNPGATSYSMTHSGNTCTYTSGTLPDQTWTWYIQASDGTNTTNSGQNRVTTDVKTSAGKAALLAQQEGVESAGGATLSVASEPTKFDINKPVLGMPIWLLAFIVVAVLVIIYILRKK